MRPIELCRGLLNAIERIGPAIVVYPSPNGLGVHAGERIGVVFADVADARQKSDDPYFVQRCHHRIGGASMGGPCPARCRARADEAKGCCMALRCPETHDSDQTGQDDPHRVTVAGRRPGRHGLHCKNGWKDGRGTRLTCKVSVTDGCRLQKGYSNKDGPTGLYIARTVSYVLSYFSRKILLDT